MREYLVLPRLFMFLPLLAGIVLATTATAQPLAGAAFSSPDERVEIEKEWREQPIRYAEGIEADIALSLDQQLYDGLLPLIQTYAKEHHLKVAVSKGTCGISAGALVKKRVDVAGFCCPPGKGDRLPGLKWHTLGISPINLIVHPENKLDNLTLAQARGVFSGEVYQWDQLVDSNRKGLIHPIGRLHCKLRPGHWLLLLGEEDDFSPDLLEVGAVPDMIRTVATDPQAIGYEVPWMIKTFQKFGKVRSLSLDGVRPENMATSGYPLYRVYSLTSWVDDPLKNPHVAALIAHLTKQIEQIDAGFQLIPASKLKSLGWKFAGDELIGEPEK